MSCRYLYSPAGDPSTTTSWMTSDEINNEYQDTFNVWMNPPRYPCGNAVTLLHATILLFRGASLIDSL